MSKEKHVVTFVCDENTDTATVSYEPGNSFSTIVAEGGAAIRTIGEDVMIRAAKEGPAEAISTIIVMKNILSDTMESMFNILKSGKSNIVREIKIAKDDRDEIIRQLKELKDGGGDDV